VSLRYRGPLEKQQVLLCRRARGSRRRRELLLRTSPLRRGIEVEKRVADGPFARSDRMSRMEAVLFLAREPLPSRKLAQLADLTDGTEARTLVRELNKFLDAEGCAFRAVEVAGGFQLMSRAQFSPWLRRLHSLSMEVRLSGPALETLAVVAYRQPVLRAAIEVIRGVQCGEILRQLMERDLVKIIGRSEDLGRPFLYGTTRQFLRVFGLRTIDELPRQEWFEAAELEASVESTEEPVFNQLKEE
jgi:segregation and condensation protein B